MNIIWITNNIDFFNAASGLSDENGLKGGAIYNLHVFKTINSFAKVEVSKKFLKKPNERFRDYIRRIRKINLKADIAIIDPIPASFGKNIICRKRITIIHHIEQNPSKTIRYFLFTKKLVNGIKRFDAVICVSEVWKSYFENMGLRNIAVIYNAYPIEDFSRNHEQKINLLKELKISDEKPVIYIGSAGNGKGSREIYNRLKNLSYTLVATGKNEELINTEVPVFQLKKEEFITLLACCDVVIANSQMTEGWNRIAHEALLCGTPVIGSGSGGMKELIDNSGQQIIENIDDLPAQIEHVIQNRKLFTGKGYEYISKYNTHYFIAEWQKIIQQINKPR